MNSPPAGRASPRPAPLPDDGDRLAPRPLHHLMTGAPLGIRPGEGWLAWLFFVYFLMLATDRWLRSSIVRASPISLNL